MEVWEFQGGGFTNSDSWGQVGEKRISELDNIKTIINVNSYAYDNENNGMIFTDETSREAIALEDRKCGSILIYKTKDGANLPSEWSAQMYIGAKNNAADTFWLDPSFWIKIITSLDFSKVEDKIENLINTVGVKASIITKDVPIVGFYINWENGTESNIGTTSFNCTNFIDISELDNLNFWLSKGNLAGYAFYDESKSYISGENNTGKSGIFYVKRPSNAKYIRISVLNTELDKFYVTNGLYAISISNIANELGESKSFVASQYLINKVYNELKRQSQYPEEIMVIPTINDKVGGITASDGTVYLGAGNELWRYTDYVPIQGNINFQIRFSRGNAIGYAFYDNDKVYISGEPYRTGEQGTIYTKKTPDNAAYIRACYNIEDTDKWFIKYTLYYPLIDIINSLEDRIDTQDEINVVLPNKLYVAKDVDCGIYYENIADILLGHENQVRISGAGLNYKRLWRYNPTSIQENKILTYRIFSSTLLDVSIPFTNTLVTVPTEGINGIKNIMFNGDSNTQRGLYSSYCFDQLLKDGDFTPVLLGRWGFSENSHREGIGSTGLSFFTNKQGVSYWCKVSRLFEEASLNLVSGGSIYEDNNGMRFTIRANYAIEGEGYMELIGNTAPTIGTLTKISGSGSESVLITSVETINQNPFWNPSTDELDFEYYITKYGFGDPDIWCISFTNNDFSENSTIEQIKNIVNGTFKKYIDKLHSQYPNCKILLVVNSMRSEFTTNDYYMRSVVNRHFCQELIKTFQNSDIYNSFVTICPVYAWIDRKLGYNTNSVIISSRSGLKEEIASDDAHCNEVGYHQWADCLYSSIRGILLGL